jgi:arylsulfatase A-like enzyme
MRTGQFVVVIVAWLCTLSGWTDSLFAQATDSKDRFRPNILWITSEDNGQHLGCYGDQFADTPNLDALAQKSVRFLNAWANAPVCASARTTILTGMYANSLGAQHMRSQVKLPEMIKPYPQLLREHGYYCSNNSKTDYNLEVDEKSLWDETSNKAHWRNRRPGQPFFAVFNITKTHESQIRTRPHQAIHNPEKVVLPPYHPDAPEVRQDWAQYYDRISEMDQQVGNILRQLEKDNLQHNTIIFYYADHGSGMPRSKRWLYESGLRVPLLVHIPERIKPLVGGEYEQGSTSEKLVSFVDLVPTVLSLLDIKSPDYLQGRAFLGKHAARAADYIYGFRDRMDERYDMSRVVRDSRYSYIRNFMPQRPQGTYLDYMFQTPATVVWKRLFDEGKLNAEQSAFWKIKPAEELYDLQTDPHQIRNLVNDAQQQENLFRLRKALQDWMLSIGDLGLLPEGEILARAGAQAPFDLAQDATKFPKADLLKAALLASDAQESDLDKLLELRVARDSAVRFWAVNGLLLRAELGMVPDECVKAARGFANDSSPYVRCIANELLARFGKDSDREASIKALLRQADIRQEGFFPGLLALNSLDWCQPGQDQVGNALTGIPAISTGMSQRYQNFVPDMVKRITSKQ